MGCVRKQGDRTFDTLIHGDCGNIAQRTPCVMFTEGLSLLYQGDAKSPQRKQTPTPPKDKLDGSLAPSTTRLSRSL
eukprot:3058740-Amphidinium_carterae.1